MDKYGRKYIEKGIYVSTEDDEKRADSFLATWSTLTKEFPILDGFLEKLQDGEIIKEYLPMKMEDYKWYV